MQKPAALEVLCLSSWRSLVIRGLAVVVGALVVSCGVPVLASAEPVCTDTWTGPAEGKWSESVNWSAGHVPTSSDVACIGSGKTVTLSSGAGVAGVVQGAGSLVVEGRFVSLEVTSMLEPSAIANLSIQEEATLTGGAEVQVTNSLNAGTYGSFTGSGSVVIESGASGTITHSVANKFIIEHETLKNAGTLTVGKEVGIAMKASAQLGKSVV